MKKDSDFYYEEGFLEALAPGLFGNSETRQCSNSVCADAQSGLTSELSATSVDARSVWSEKLIFSDLNTIYESDQDYFKLSAQDFISDSDSPSQCADSDSSSTRACALASEEVNKQSDSGVRARCSSTEEGFLDLEGNFFVCWVLHRHRRHVW